jgi:pimeloyl-ACP methyl ester carboxylesterase
MKTKKFFDYAGVTILAICLFAFVNMKTDDVAVSSDGVDISFDKQGEGKPAIIFIHGWTNPRTIWDDQMDHFSKDYTAIAIDLPGSGKSGTNRDEWTMEAFANDVIAVMNKLKLENAVLVGFSMGAMVAVETANNFPDRVIGIVSVDELKFPYRPIPEEMIPAMVEGGMTMVTSGMTNEGLVAGGFYKRNQEVSFARITKLYEGASPAGWKESLEGALIWMSQKQKSALTNLKVPYVGIFSDKEPFEMDSIKAYVPSFKGKVLTNTGHLVFWDAPEEFNSLLEKYIKEFEE